MYRKALVYFMKAKAKEIKRQSGLPETVYFSEEDAAEMQRWPEDRAREAWTKIYDALTMNVYNSAKLCPYCVLFSCAECPYAKRHGMCNSEESDFARIVWKVGSISDLYDLDGWFELFKECSKRAGIKEVM